MKKYILNLFIILTGIASAQEYVFDRLVQYEENSTNTIQIYYHSQNSTYYMQLVDDGENPEANIFDKEAKKIHRFDVKQVQESNGLIYEYGYDKTSKLLLGSELESGISYEFKTKRDDKYYRFDDLLIYSQDNQENPIITADLSMRYAEENKFDVFNLCCLLGFSQSSAIKTDNKFVVVKAKVTDRKGKEFNYQLIDDQVVQFKLRVKEK